jgi:hypothetical protein
VPDQTTLVGTISHTRKQCLASALIGSDVRKAADHGTANFRTRGTGLPVSAGSNNT